MHRIIFTGAQGTGKTTVLKEFESRGQRVITEVVRELMKKGVKINKDGDEKGQAKIFKTYKDLLGELSADGYISDRGLLDVTAYTMYLYQHGQVSDKFLQKQIKQLKAFKESTPDIIYCFFPIEFPVVDDGVRDMDEDFRKEIEYNILELMAIVGISPIVITGSVEARVKKIERVYNWLNEGMALFTEHLQDPSTETTE